MTEQERARAAIEYMQELFRIEIVDGSWVRLRQALEFTALSETTDGWVNLRELSKAAQREIAYAIKHFISMQQNFDSVTQHFEDRDNAKPHRHNISEKSVREEVWLKTDGCCIYCNASLTHPGNEASGPDASRMHVDHWVPRTNGGPDHLSNYVPACGPCNGRKGTLDPIEFVRSLRKREEADQ